MKSREEFGGRRSGRSQSGSRNQLWLPAPLRQSWEQLVGLTVMCALVVLIVVLAIASGDPAQIVPTLSMFGAVIEPAVGWALPSAIAFVALAHVAVVGGELDPEKHRVYLSSLSVASVCVTAGVTLSSLLIVFSWLAVPERFILLVPLLPLLAVVIVVGLHLGRFNNVDAETELRFVERELLRVEEKRSGLDPQSPARSVAISVLHVLALLGPATWVLLATMGSRTSTGDALFVVFATLLVGLVVAMPAYFVRVSVDRPSNAFWLFAFWLFPSLVIFGGVILPIAEGAATLLFVSLPALLVQLSFAPTNRQLPFTMARVIDSFAERSLANQARRLELRRLTIVAELERVRPSVMQKLRDLVWPSRR